MGSALELVTCYDEDGDTIMCTEFWDRQGILLIIFYSTVKQSINMYNCETLNNLRHTIQNKGQGMLSKGVIFIYDHILQM